MISPILQKGPGSVPTVVFDVRANHDTGVSRYGLSLLAAVAPLVAATGWRLISVARPVQAERARAATAGLDLPVVVCPDDEGFVRQSQWLRDLLVKEKADLYYSSHYTVDRQCPVPFVFTIHDLTRLRFPEFSYTDESFTERFGASELRLIHSELDDLADWDEHRDGDNVFTRYFRASNHFLAERAERVTTVSHATASDITTLLGIAPSRLDLVPCAVDTKVFHRRDVASVDAVKAAHNLRGPYLMFVGLAHPNKRFPWLIEQLLAAQHRFPDGSKLVAIGGHAEQVSDIQEQLHRRSAKDFVVFTGRVTETELAALYSGAAALITASINEGNNLPPLEALSCGSQVVATDIPPLRETLGQAASFYDPADGERLAALAEASLGGRLADRSKSFAPPSWSDSGRAIVDALHRALPTFTISTTPA